VALAPLAHDWRAAVRARCSALRWPWRWLPTP